MADYKLVPVEPTKEMIQAAHSIECGVYQDPLDEIVYKAMLEAAPSPWQPIETAPYHEEILLFGIPNGEIHGKLDAPAIAVGSRINSDCFEMENTDCYSVYIEATHWMPLPETPK